MSFRLNDVVPWGRSYDEYAAMFALSGADLAGKLLGCGDGPAAFNAVFAGRGGHVVSVDPLYRFTKAEIALRIDETYPVMAAQTRANAQEFVWKHVADVEALTALRRDAMDIFLADYDAGKAEGRYVEGALPVMPFANHTFDLALCSHFLFLYSAHFDLAFHVASIRELCRVAREVRIFPLLELGTVRARHLDPVFAQLADLGYAATIERVDYEFQRGGDEMLRVRGGAS
jgi:hypothetical protein